MTPKTITSALSIFSKKTIQGLLTFCCFLFLFNAQAQCPTAPGDQTTYGAGLWIGYVYTGLNTSNPPTNAFTTTYRGYMTQSETFNMDLGSNSLTGTNICGTYSGQFAIRFKMQKTFTAGNYTFTVGGDDGYRLSFDGGATFPLTNWNDHAYTTTSYTIYLNGATNLVLEYYEQAGVSRISYSSTACNNSTNPTAITGTSSLCYGTGGTTLAATGGIEVPGCTYQWGTGSTIGSNIIAGQSTSTMYINPTTTTTYWVRRVDAAPCAATTAGITQTINVSTASTNPTSISSTATTICSGTPITLTAVGGTTGTGGTYQWGTGWTVGSNIIAGQTASTLSVSPTTSTVYWVRRVDPAPCNTQTPGVALSIAVATPPTAPTSISGTTAICSGTSIPLTAMGGNVGTNGSYQWGTGSVVGSNIIAGQTYYIMWVNPTVTTTYWVRIVDTAPCNATTAGVTQVITVGTASAGPYSIAGNTTTCSGANLTLTASGGTMGTGAVYQWGTGSTVGSNIIAGQTGVSIVVNPTTSGSYWVRRIDPAPCSTQTSGTSTYINVTPASTAPTSISGAGAAACAGNSTTLTAVGGSLASGASYQWGTGSTIGSNVIAGQTGATINVTPATTTTYWVRIADASPCASYTAGVSTVITITPPVGNPNTYGDNVWNFYGYTNGDITLATAIYDGYYSVNSLSFDTQTGTNSWVNTSTPSSAAGWSGCPVPADYFTYSVKRKGFPCGTYSLVMQNWDDEAQVYLNGTLIWSSATWSGIGNYNLNIGSYNLDSNSKIEIRIREINGLSNVNLVLTKTSVDVVRPTSITASPSTICGTGSSTLTAVGGTLGTTGTYQWGTGTTVGANVISGATTSTLTVSPTTTTTYWVTIVDSGSCGSNNSGEDDDDVAKKTITVTADTVAGTLSASVTTICKNTPAGPITLTGNVGNVIKWQYANDAAFTSGVTNISVTATVLSSANIGLLTATRYYRAVVQSSNCSTQYTTPIGIIVPTTVTYNGSWNGTPSSTTPVIISSSYTLPSNLTACSCQVTGTAVVTVPAGISLIVQKDITVAATASIVVESTGTIVQVDDTSSDVGNITFKRNTTPVKQFDYTYWSSPLTNQALNITSSPSYYYEFNPSINNWANKSGTDIMTPGKGYISRAPSNLNYASPQIVQATFVGVPNNGVIGVPITKVDGDTYNLIGNPYPSAINIDNFLLDANNSAVVDGTIYLWTHNTAISNTIPGTAVYNYTRDDYAKYNITGGVKTGSAAITGGVTPNGKIAAGQGFFIAANPALANGTYNATFNNSMRVANNSNQFFKTNSIVVDGPMDGNTPVIEKNRVWINMTNEQGAYSEALVGYITNATNGMDALFDGKTFPTGNVVSLYSTLDANELSIQGRALPFDQNDIVPLGYNTSIGGDFKIALEDFDGLFQNQNVYLLDKTTNTYQDLKAGSYSFNSAIGTFDTRFELRFTNGTLSTSQQSLGDTTVDVIRKDQHVAVRAINHNINSVEVFDILGKRIYAKNQIDSNEFNTADLNMAPQIIIVRVILDDNTVVSKKVFIK